MMLTSHDWIDSYHFCSRITCCCCFSCVTMWSGINFLCKNFAANVQLYFPFHSGENNLVDEMINKNVSMITTSHDFVLMKNGTEMASPTNCINTPNDRFTCRMMKYAVTTRNDPMILPAVSIFIVHKGTNRKDLRSQGDQSRNQYRTECLSQVLYMMLVCNMHQSLCRWT